MLLSMASGLGRGHTIFSRVNDDVAKQSKKANVHLIHLSNGRMQKRTIGRCLGTWVMGPSLATETPSIFMGGQPIVWVSRPIIHGVYLLARALGELELAGHETENDIVLSARFHCQVMVRFQYRKNRDGSRLPNTSRKGE